MTETKLPKVKVAERGCLNGRNCVPKTPIKFSEKAENLHKRPTNIY